MNKNISLDLIRENIRCIVTHVQLDEINQTKDEEHKQNLLNIFNSVTDEMISTSSFVVGISRCGQAKLSNGKLFNALLEGLNKKNKKKKNNQSDALIAETAINNDFALITHDMELLKIVTAFDGAVANLYYVIKPNS